MDIFKYIFSELSYFIKAALDISVQKISLLLRRNNSGL
jgi:hypothetical protein